jgi:ribosomal protein S27AE
MKECEECGEEFEERGDWQKYCYSCYLELKDRGDLNSGGNNNSDSPINKKCERCGNLFLAKGNWQTYCSSCFKIIKKEEIESMRKQITMLQEKLIRIQNSGKGELGEELDEKFLINLIKLCHPDVHQNSKLSNNITAELLKMKMRKKNR